MVTISHSINRTKLFFLKVHVLMLWKINYGRMIFVEKIKILFLNPTLGSGGIERSLCDLLRHIDYGKYSVSLYLDATNGVFFDQLPKEVRIITPNMDNCYGSFVSVLKYLLNQRDFARLWLRIVKLLVPRLGYNIYYLLRPVFSKYGIYDYVISYKEGETAQFAMRAFRYKKLISWWHCASKSVDVSEFQNYNKIDRLVAVSPSAKNIMNEILPETQSSSCVIPNIVDVHNIRKMANREMKIDNDNAINIVTIARLSSEKHLGDIAVCAERLLQSGISFKWHIIGTGLLENELKSLFKSCGLETHIVFEGELKNPYTILRNADLYVHTSYIESQGLTILEAMALGVPCVVTKSLGPCEFIQSGVNGILAERSPESLAENVLKILTDEELYRRIKENTCCPEQFAPENVIQNFEKLLEEIR